MCGSFVASGPGQRVIIKITPHVYQGVLQDHVSVTVCHRRLSGSLEMQQENDPKPYYRII